MVVPTFISCGIDCFFTIWIYDKTNTNSLYYFCNYYSLGDA